MERKEILERLSQEETMRTRCLDCNKIIPREIETDIQLCQECMKNYDVDKLWRMHDNGELDALDFNESKQMREKFRRIT